MGIGSKRGGGVVSSIVKNAQARPGVFAVYLIARVGLVILFVECVLAGRYEYALLCVLVAVLLYVPDFIERKLSVELPDVLEIIIIFFIIAAEVLGEMGSFYVKIPYWDTMLHTLWGFLAAGIGFALVDILNRSDSTSLNLTPLFMAVVAFCFSMSVGALWELFEYAMDSSLGFDMQKDTWVTAFGSVALDPTNSNVVVPVTDIASTQITLASGEVIVLDGYLDIGIHDSMADLFVNMIGALVFSLIGFAFVKGQGRSGKRSLARHFIPRVKKGD